MLFSYGFIDPNCQAGKLVLPLEPMEDDPLTKAKMHVFGATPTIQIEDGEDGVPIWSAPFAYLMCLNEEDGLNFAVLQETDGSQQLKLFWQDDDATGHSHDVKSLIEGHELCKVFELRVVTVVLEQLQQQLEGLKLSVNSRKYPGPTREDVVRTVMHLRAVEQDLLERMVGSLEGQVSVCLVSYRSLEQSGRSHSPLLTIGRVLQRDELFSDDSVLAYLGSMEPTPNDEGGQVADEDFS